MAKAKATAFNDLYASLAEKEGQQRAIRIARQMNRELQDIYQAKQMKDSDERILLDGEEIKEQWKSYFEKLMNVENKRVRQVKEPGKEVQVAGITRQEVGRALKKMKRGIAVEPDDIPAEAWKVLGGKGLDSLTEVFANIMETEYESRKRLQDHQR